MQFLGDLGIDIRLLVAQVVNFGILLWLLTKLLYKPIIKRIERDEIELKQAQVLTSELEQQKKIFEEQKKQEITEAKKKAKNIIEEAENIAKEIKKEILEKTDNEIEILIKQSKSRVNSLRPEIEKDVLKKIRTEIGVSFYASFLSVLPLSSQKEFQKVFWTNFINQVKTIVVPRSKRFDLIKTLEKFSPITKHGERDKDISENKLKDAFTKKIGPIVLEYTYILTVEQEKEIEKIISEKIGYKLHVVKRQNRDLINGFRFEFAGIIIECNLFNILQDALRFKEYEK